MNWELKAGALEEHYEALSGFSGGPEDKGLGKFAKLSLKLALYILLEIIKIVCLLDLIKKMLLQFKTYTVVFVIAFS